MFLANGGYNSKLSLCELCKLVATDMQFSTMDSSQFQLVPRQMR